MLFVNITMNGTTLVLTCVGAYAFYAIYVNLQQDRRKKVMYAKHDKPMERQKLGKNVNTAHSRYETQKKMFKNPFGILDEKYITPV